MPIKKGPLLVLGSGPSCASNVQDATGGSSGRKLNLPTLQVYHKGWYTQAQMLLELEEPIEVTTELGDGYAILVEACNHDHWWTVVLSNGALVTFPQKKIRVKRNYTFNRGINSEEMKKIIA